MSEGICADCSSPGESFFKYRSRERGSEMDFFSIYPDPSWASINHGVLICDECCSVHRSLGRHISFIRSLHSTSWPPALREVRNLIFKIINNVSISFLSLSVSFSLPPSPPLPLYHYLLFIHIGQMVSTLVRKGSNSIWEHALHDSSSKVKLKKPSPRDKLQ